MRNKVVLRGDGLGILIFIVYVVLPLAALGVALLVAAGLLVYHLRRKKTPEEEEERVEGRPSRKLPWLVLGAGVRGAVVAFIWMACT